MGEALQLPPAAALLARPVTAAAQKEHSPVIPKGQALFVLVQIHPVDIRGVFQGQHIGAVLIQLQEVAAVLVENREVGGDDDLVRRNGPAVGDRLAGGQLQHLGVFINPQVLGDGSDKLEGVELGLTGEFYRSRCGEGEGNLFHKLCPEAQLAQGIQLPVQLFSVVQGVDKGVLFLEITVEAYAQGAVLLQRLLVGLQVEPGPVRAELPDQLVADQPVLGGDLRCGVFGDAAADAVRLHQGAVHPRLGQLIGAQNSGQPAADDEHIGFQV